MPAFTSTTLTLGLATGAISGNSSPVTVTITTSADYPDAITYAATAVRTFGGIRADNNIFYPSSSILNIVNTSYS